MLSKIIHFQLYERSKRAVLNMDYETMDKLIQQYDEQIELLEGLVVNCESSFDTVVTQINQGLEGPINNLEASKKTLETTNNILKE